eukprot:GHVL01024558.1.p1 GENE.GHVL01024558.1~~GHVL01024558.1.p1  ORF type:complete len:813 (+),score=178.78 GHVL01024558.1:131-2569(+)
MWSRNKRKSEPTESTVPSDEKAARIQFLEEELENAKENVQGHKMLLNEETKSRALLEKELQNLRSALENERSTPTGQSDALASRAESLAKEKLALEQVDAEKSQRLLQLEAELSTARDMWHENIVGQSSSDSIPLVTYQAMHDSLKRECALTSQNSEMLTKQNAALRNEVQDLLEREMCLSDELKAIKRAREDENIEMTSKLRLAEHQLSTTNRRIDECDDVDELNDQINELITASRNKDREMARLREELEQTINRFQVTPGDGTDPDQMRLKMELQVRIRALDEATRRVSELEGLLEESNRSQDTSSLMSRIFSYKTEIESLKTIQYLLERRCLEAEKTSKIKFEMATNAQERLNDSMDITSNQAKQYKETIHSLRDLLSAQQDGTAALASRFSSARSEYQNQVKLLLSEIKALRGRGVPATYGMTGPCPTASEEMKKSKTVRAEEMAAERNKLKQKAIACNVIGKRRKRIAQSPAVDVEKIKIHPAERTLSDEPTCHSIHNDRIQNDRIDSNDRIDNDRSHLSIWNSNARSTASFGESPQFDALEMVSDNRSNNRSDNRSDNYSNVHSDNRSDIRSDNYSFVHSDNRSDIRSDNRSDNYSNVQSDNRIDNQYDNHSDKDFIPQEQQFSISNDEERWSSPPSDISSLKPPSGGELCSSPDTPGGYQISRGRSQVDTVKSRQVNTVKSRQVNSRQSSVSSTGYRSDVKTVINKTESKTRYLESNTHIRRLSVEEETAALVVAAHSRRLEQESDECSDSSDEYPHAFIGETAMLSPAVCDLRSSRSECPPPAPQLKSLSPLPVITSNKPVTNQ